MFALTGTYAIFGVFFAHKSGAFRRAIQICCPCRENDQPAIVLPATSEEMNSIELRVCFLINKK